MKILDQIKLITKKMKTILTSESVDPSISLLQFARGKSLTLRVGTTSPKISLTRWTGGGLVIP